MTTPYRFTRTGKKFWKKALLPIIGIALILGGLIWIYQKGFANGFAGGLGGEIFRNTIIVVGSIILVVIFIKPLAKVFNIKLKIG